MWFIIVFFVIGSLADALENPIGFPYSEIPHFPVSTVPGHAGRLVFGQLRGVSVVCMQGRFHYYEGYPLWKCTLPVRVFKLLGVTHLIATNAAGAINPTLKVGDIMLIMDHVNMMGFSGNNPLYGPNEDRFGPRFPAMSQAYDRNLIQRAMEIGERLGMKDILREGVYSCLGGPNFETVAENKMMRICGVDAIGMSTVHEVIIAVHCDLIVFAFSLITNCSPVSYDNNEVANHEEVMDVGNKRADLLKNFVTEIVEDIGYSLHKCAHKRRNM